MYILFWNAEKYVWQYILNIHGEKAEESNRTNIYRKRMGLSKTQYYQIVVNNFDL